MDVSKEIFKLEKEDIHFIINSSTVSRLSSSSTHSINSKPLGETEITVINLTSEYIAFRVQTTNKKKYTVHPTHEIIKPNGNHTFKIIYYSDPEKILDPNDQKKFKLEGFIIPEEKKNEQAKDLFTEYAEKEIKVQGNFIKLRARFTIEEDIKENNNSISDKEKLENLKSEYNQLKKEVENLRENEELLNEKIKIERNRQNIVPEYEKFRFNLPDIKEKPFARNILIAIFAFSVLLGFYLIK